MPATTPLKNARIEIRVTEEQKRTIERAANLEGRTLTDFVSSLTVAQAEEIVEREHVLRLPDEAYDAFVELLNRPPKFNAGLAHLFRKPPVWQDPEFMASAASTSASA
jgi:uncharacterized protein (DUF1778 family)